MKKLLYIWLLFAGLQGYGSSVEALSDGEEGISQIDGKNIVDSKLQNFHLQTIALSNISDNRLDFQRFLQRCTPNDTIFSIIEGRDFLVYATCGNFWTVVSTSAGGTLVAVSGNPLSSAVQIDTIDNCPILTWGLYSLSDNSKGKVPVENAEWSPICQWIELYSADKSLIFEDVDVKYYKGRDGKVFTKNIKSLKSILWWFNIPTQFRAEVLPPSCIQFNNDAVE